MFGAGGGAVLVFLRLRLNVRLVLGSRFPLSCAVSCFCVFVLGLVVRQLEQQLGTKSRPDLSSEASICG
jgi:hypothetical protein